MGYSSRRGSLGHQITDYWPDDSDFEMYISGDAAPNITDIINWAKQKWPEAKMEEITIEPEHIHTECIYYDLHDPMDYTNFIVLRYDPN